MTTFPEADTAERFAALTDAGLRPAVLSLCAELGYAGAGLRRFEDGSVPVYALGEDLVLKLFPPVHAEETAIESGVLRALSTVSTIPSPAVEQVGTRDGWGYVLMTRLPGSSAAEVWPRLSTSDRATLVADLGRTLATLHAVDVSRAPLGPADWSSWIEEQRATVVQRQRAVGTAESWIAQIPGFLDSVRLCGRDGGPPRPVLLHTECMREHLLLAQDPEGWRLSGIFDFEPAMLGAREYEFAAVGMFVSCGDAELLHALLLAYGYTPDELTPEFSRRCLAYTLLHKYSNLRWYLSRLPAPPEPTLDSLATTWWGVG